MKEDGPLNPDHLDNAYRIAYLIAGHIRKTLTSAERRELDAWLDQSEQHIELFEELTDDQNIDKALSWYDQKRRDQSFKSLEEKIPFVAPIKKKTFPLLAIAVAASFILLAGASIYLFSPQRKMQPSAPIAKNTKSPQDAMAGKYGAILTLSNGQTIVLDSTQNGNLTVQGNTEVLKKDSLLSYQGNGQLGIHQEVTYNTLTIPKGRQYQLILPDGTKVWLNAASSLRYPTAFTAKNRQVELTGEAYFEVVHNPSQPFMVQIGSTQIKDIGTTFNINSYGDEAGITTTLITGSVQVVQGFSVRLLHPGEQAHSQAGNISVSQADIPASIGWKEGHFVFHKATLHRIAKEIERWYNIEVVLDAHNTNHLTATIDRKLPLSQLLHLLEETGGVRFTWQEGKLFIRK